MKRLISIKFPFLKEWECSEIKKKIFEFYQFPELFIDDILDFLYMCVSRFGTTFVLQSSMEELKYKIIVAQSVEEIE